MSQRIIDELLQPEPATVPIATNYRMGATMTLPWFVQRSIYYPRPTSFSALVNGEQAFAAVYDAILAAESSIDIICWGFQPSMYFRRGHNVKPISHYLALLQKNDFSQDMRYANTSAPIGYALAWAAHRGVQVRILCWDSQTGAFGEDNMPGNSLPEATAKGFHAKLNNASAALKHELQQQLEFDKLWYAMATRESREPHTRNPLDELTNTPTPLAAKHPSTLQFATRGFAGKDGGNIQKTINHYNDGLAIKVEGGANEQVRLYQRAALTLYPSHHQKMVLVDYGKKKPVGFVMGHNMLDEYWDRDRHSARREAPHLGRVGNAPRQDISSRVTGPILSELSANFCQAWDKAHPNLQPSLAEQRKPTDNALRNFDDDASRALHAEQSGTPVMAQLVRTQVQYGEKDIAKMYLQAVNNVDGFIYIENQYFRWTPISTRLKDLVNLYQSKGRTKPIHLFVVTNDNNEALDKAQLSTFAMLQSLGKGSQMPELSKQESQHKLHKAVEDERKLRMERERLETAATRGDNYARWRIEELRAWEKQAKDEQMRLFEQIKHPDVPPDPDIPGLKVHLCSLVSPDSPPGAWQHVYIHAKCMIVDDVMTTIGSANINFRSMFIDSELNIFHESQKPSRDLRRKLWGIHTRMQDANDSVVASIGKRANSDDPVEAFKAWGEILKQNTYNRAKNLSPAASLVPFLYSGNKHGNAD